MSQWGTRFEPMGVKRRTAPPPAALGLETVGPRRQTAVQRSGSLAGAHLLSCSVAPTCGTTGPRNPFRLPALTTAQRPYRQTPVVSLSFSEPPLFTPGEKANFSQTRRPDSLQKRPPPPRPLNRPGVTRLQRCWNHGQNRRRALYTHFSQPIRPRCRSPSGGPTQSPDDLRPLVMRYQRGPSNEEALSVVGKPYLLGCGQTLAPMAASLSPERGQLHVFLPTDQAGRTERADSDSVDEGFMDELDSKITALRLQWGGPQTVADR